MEKKKTKNGKNGKMTLDKLAGMMARGFDETNAKLDQMDGKFELVNDRLEKIEDKVEQIDFHIFELNSRGMIADKEVKLIKKRVDNLERRDASK